MEGFSKPVGTYTRRIQIKLITVAKMKFFLARLFLVISILFLIKPG
jgi:hypothetical protein